MQELNTKELEQLLKKARGKEKKRDFSKLIVISVILLNVLFTFAVFYAFLKTANEPTALIVAWFGFTTVELWSLSKITREKNKEEYNEEQY